MRPLVAEIRLNHLTENYRQLKQAHHGRLLAVVKANAYGHGAVRCAQALADDADGFAVACLEEAVVLREAGIIRPIVLLDGVFDVKELLDTVWWDVWLVVQNKEQLDMLLNTPLDRELTVWLKMDTGMHRAGFSPEEYLLAYRRLADCQHVADIVHMTHFACADEPESVMTSEQLQVFDHVCQGLSGEVSVANSAATMLFDFCRKGWGRAGLAMYGIAPNNIVSSIPLKPVMRLSTRVFGVRSLPAGEPIGYGATFTTSRPSRIGLIACGYADGYPRSVPNGTPVLVDGRPGAYIAGRVSMDMITIDLTDVPQADIGSEVELWGEGISANTVADSAGTISYELLCHVKRAQFKYII